MLTIFSHNFQFFFYEKAIELILIKIIIPKSCFHILFSFSHYFSDIIENKNEKKKPKNKKSNKQTQTSFSLKVPKKTGNENFPPNHKF